MNWGSAKELAKRLALKARLRAAPMINCTGQRSCPFKTIKPYESSIAMQKSMPSLNYIGTAVFLAGLKNGSFTTFAVTFCRMASIVISICSLLPSCACAVSMLASAIIIFITGYH